MKHPLFSDLRRHQVETAGAMMAAMKRAKDALALKVREAADRDDIGRDAFQRAFYGRVSGIYEQLAEELDAQLEDASGITVNQVRKAAINDIRSASRKTKFVKAPVVKWDAERQRRYWEMIHPENAPSLAAVFTQKMAAEDIRDLRQAVTRTFRQADLEGWTAKERIRELQKAWDEEAGDTGASRFISKDGAEWTNARYLQMLVRTTQSRLARESYIDTLIEHGDDLARVVAAGDNCKVCEAWQGLILSVSGTNPDHPAYEDAIASGLFHPNCLPGDSLVSVGRVLGAFRARFRGDLIRVVLRGGFTLRVTPHHPVLTARGWVDAERLQQGDQVLRAVAGERMPGDAPDVDGHPARIDEVFMAFRQARGVTARQVPAAPEHFHGDGGMVDGEIEVVFADGVLGADGKPRLDQGGGKADFVGADVGFGAGASGGDLGAVLRAVGLATDRRMGGNGTLEALLRGGGSVPGGKALRGAAQHDPRGAEGGGDAGAAYAELFREWQDVFPGVVAADQIIQVDRQRFDGHVYDLLTGEGAYLAGDSTGAMAVVSNCDCYLERIDETVDAADTEAQAGTKNPEDWGDLDALREYRDEAGLERPDPAADGATNFSDAAAAAFRRELE